MSCQPDAAGDCKAWRPSRTRSHACVGRLLRTASYKSLGQGVTMSHHSRGCLSRGVKMSRRSRGSLSRGVKMSRHLRQHLGRGVRMSADRGSVGEQMPSGARLTCWHPHMPRVTRCQSVSLVAATSMGVVTSTGTASSRARSSR